MDKEKISGIEGMMHATSGIVFDEGGATLGILTWLRNGCFGHKSSFIGKTLYDSFAF